MEYHFIEFSLICFRVEVKLMLNSLSDGETQVEAQRGHLKVSI